MMCWRVLKQLITYVNLVIYISKLKDLAKFHNESEMWVRKWLIQLTIKGKKYYSIFWIHQFLFMTFPPFSLDDLMIVFSAHEKLTDHVKSWHLHSQTMSQNFKKIGSSVLELLPFFSSNDPADNNAFGQFRWFSHIGSRMCIKT